MPGAATKIPVAERRNESREMATHQDQARWDGNGDGLPELMEAKMEFAIRQRLLIQTRSRPTEIKRDGTEMERA